MADFGHRELEIGLEFGRLSFAKCNNFSEDFLNLKNTPK